MTLNFTSLVEAGTSVLLGVANFSLLFARNSCFLASSSSFISLSTSSPLKTTVIFGVATGRTAFVIFVAVSGFSVFGGAGVGLLVSSEAFLFFGFSLGAVGSLKSY